MILGRLAAARVHLKTFTDGLLIQSLGSQLMMMTLGSEAAKDCSCEGMMWNGFLTRMNSEVFSGSEMRLHS